jgi:tetraacyldisaccharide 4'-kinase
VAILDDGFQHHALARDLDLVLLSADDPDPEHVLPRGPYREPWEALGRADAVVVTRRSAGPERARRLAAEVGRHFEGLVVGCVHLAPGAWTELGGAPAEAPDGDVLAACGVARPEAFRHSVEQHVDGGVELVSFSDHHVYTASDVARLTRRARGRPIVITEKDAAKLGAWAGAAGASLGRVWVLADELRWDWGEDSVCARVLEVVAAGIDG